MIYFYALIANGTHKKHIPKSFLHAFKQLEDLNVLESEGTRVKLKPQLLLGTLDISSTHTYFLKSLQSTHKEDFLLETGRAESQTKSKRTKQQAHKKAYKNTTYGFVKGDIVLAKLTKQGKARFITLLYRAKPYVLATLRMKKGTIQAFELRTQSPIPLQVSQKSLRALPPHCVVKVEIASGNIIEVFGVLEDARIDEYIALHSAQNIEFSHNALQEAKAFGDEVYKQMYPHRIDLSHLPFCVIDPENARDHDDAIYFDSKHRTLYVAIADVSEYVSMESALDKEARSRGFSLYFPHKVIPMLPFELSSGICSLKANQLRLVMVWQITFDKKKQVSKSTLFEALITSQATLSYECIEAFLQEKGILTSSPTDSTKITESAPLKKSKSANTQTKSALPKKIQKWLIEYVPYVQAIKAQRLRNGYEFHTKEIALTLDEKAEVQSVRELEHTLAHSIIEESMLLANKESAKFLETYTDKALFRIHPPPKRTKVLLWELENLGFTLPPTQDLHHIICTLQKECDESLREVLDSLLIKSLAKATYSTHNVGHFGLGFESYTHFTSPIRRYSDLIVHRILKALLHQKKSLPFLLEGLEGIACEINAKEKQISHIEQEFYHYKMLRYAKKLLDSKKPLICLALVIDELSHCIALDTLPQVKITLLQSLSRFERIKVEITEVDLFCGRIQGKVIES